MVGSLGSLPKKPPGSCYSNGARDGDGFPPFNLATGRVNVKMSGLPYRGNAFTPPPPAPVPQIPPNRNGRIGLGIKMGIGQMQIIFPPDPESSSSRVGSPVPSSPVPSSWIRFHRCSFLHKVHTVGRHHRYYTGLLRKVSRPVSSPFG